MGSDESDNHQIDSQQLAESYHREITKDLGMNQEDIDNIRLEAPREIYLQLDPDGEGDITDIKNLDEIATWCKDRVFDNDVAYTRSDIAAQWQADALRFAAITQEQAKELERRDRNQTIAWNTAKRFESELQEQSKEIERLRDEARDKEIASDLRLDGLATANAGLSSLVEELQTENKRLRRDIASANRYLGADREEIGSLREAMRSLALRILEDGQTYWAAKLSDLAISPTKEQDNG